MKKNLALLFGSFILFTLVTSCKKDKKNAATNNLPPAINKIVSQAVIDSLKKHGTTINEGITPPLVNGTYYLGPNICLYDNSDDNRTGDTFDDYEYKFSGQNNSTYTIRIDSKDVEGDDISTDSTSTFISGANNSFSIFAQSKGIASGVTNTRLEIISGTFTTTGIKNLQLTVYLQEKGPDPSGALAPVGTIRIFYDSDNLSELKSDFSISKNVIQSLNKLTNKSLLSSKVKTQ